MRLIYPVVDLLLDCISLLVRDDTPAIVVTTFEELNEELNRVLLGSMQVANQREDHPYQFDTCVDLRAEVGLFEILQCSSRAHLASLSASGCKQIDPVIHLAVTEMRGHHDPR
jgi:hypothetical protein